MAKGIHSRQNKRNKRVKAAQIKEYELEQLKKLSATFDNCNETKDEMDLDTPIALPSLGKETTRKRSR